MRERGVIREGSGRRERSGFGVETEEATVAAFMVSNLLTVLCSERTQPVVNAGSLYT